MTFVAVPGIAFPNTYIGNPRLTWQLSENNIGTMDANGEKVAMVGHVFWEGAPTSAKTMGSSSKLHWKSGDAIFNNAGTNIRIGLQDLETASGTFLTPDGTFDVYADVVGGGGGIGNIAAVTTTLATSGSKSVAHGDLIAIVWDMTTRAGSDSVIVRGLPCAATWMPPGTLVHIVAWAPSTSVPDVVLEADDGTFGILSSCPYQTGLGTHAYQASTNPDERGLIFRVPIRCKIDGAWVTMGTALATADATIRLYADPLGTPAEITSLSVLGEQGNNSATAKPRFYPLTEQTLEPNTDYCLAVEATGTANVSIAYATVVAAHRSVMGLANCRAGNRNNQTGAFSETTTEIPFIAVRISALDDGIGMARANLALGVI